MGLEEKDREEVEKEERKIEELITRARRTTARTRM